jgi:hypothetical protein
MNKSGVSQSLMKSPKIDGNISERLVNIIRRDYLMREKEIGKTSLGKENVQDLKAQN